MKQRLVLIFTLVLLLSSCSVTSRYARHSEYQPLPVQIQHEGILESVILPSSESQIEERRAVVYLPKDYYNSNQSYPVLYLLHGARGTETTWIELGNILQSVDSCSAGDFILVLPNMNSYRSVKDYGFSRAKTAISTFFGVDGTVERVFIHDVVEEIDKRYRTIADKDHRAMAGMSIGAMQTIYISATNPDIFGSLGLFSPFIHTIIKPGKNASYYRGIWKKLANQFENPPKDYIIMIGKKDFFYHPMIRFDRKLTKNGYSHTFLVFEGGHQWYNWETFALDFINSSNALN